MNIDKRLKKIQRELSNMASDAKEQFREELGDILASLDWKLGEMKRKKISFDKKDEKLLGKLVAGYMNKLEGVA